MHRLLSITACALLALLVLAGCGLTIPGSGNGSSVRIVVADRVLAGSKSIMPPHSLVGDHYTVHGAGTSGQANGASFDLTITAAEGSASLNLLPGDWTVTATVFNAEPLAIGEGTQSATIQVGVPATISITCLPYTGSGTVAASFSWVPDVLAVPQVETELVGFDSVTHALPVTLDSSTAAHGSLTIEQGWYSAFLRLKDNGVLSAGVVRALRVAAGQTTTWTEFLTVNQLQGSVTVDLQYNPGLPLNVATTPAAGNVSLYNGQQTTFTITGADNDAGTSLIYAWYINGQAAAVSTSNALTVSSSSYDVGTRVYVSAVAFQSDGRRAGDAQWTGLRSDMDPALYRVAGTIGNGSPGSQIVVELIGADGASVLDRNVIPDATSVVSFAFEMVPAGGYYVRGGVDLNHNGVLDEAGYWQWYGYPGTHHVRPADFAANVTSPIADAGVRYNFTGTTGDGW